MKETYRVPWKCVPGGTDLWRACQKRLPEESEFKMNAESRKEIRQKEEENIFHVESILSKSSDKKRLEQAAWKN